jgi:hypothetical protein
MHDDIDDRNLIRNKSPHRTRPLLDLGEGSEQRKLPKIRGLSSLEGLQIRSTCTAVVKLSALLSPAHPIN